MTKFEEMLLNDVSTHVIQMMKGVCETRRK